MTCNFFWGDSPMSWLRYMTLFSFRVMHPDWRIVLHTVSGSGKHWDSEHECDQEYYDGYDWREKLDEIGVEVFPYMDLGLSVVQTADVCQWDVMAHGGVFAGIDQLFLRPIDDLNLTDNALTIEKGVAYLGITSGRVGGSRLFAQIRDLAMKVDNDYQTAGVEALYRYVGDKPCVNALDIMRDKSGEEARSIPKVHGHPFPPHWVWHYKRELSDDIYSIHWFGGYADSKDATLRLHPDYEPSESDPTIIRKFYEIWSRGLQ